MHLAALHYFVLFSLAASSQSSLKPDHSSGCAQRLPAGRAAALPFLCSDSLNLCKPWKAKNADPSFSLARLSCPACLFSLIMTCLSVIPLRRTPCPVSLQKPFIVVLQTKSCALTAVVPLSRSDQTFCAFDALFLCVAATAAAAATAAGTASCWHYVRAGQASKGHSLHSRRPF